MQAGQPLEQLHRRAAEDVRPLAVGEFGTGLDLLAAGDSEVAAQVGVVSSEYDVSVSGSPSAWALGSGEGLGCAKTTAARRCSSSNSG